MFTDPFTLHAHGDQQTRLKDVREELHRLRLNIPRYRTAESNLVRKLARKRQDLEEGQRRLIELEAELATLSLPPDGPLTLHSGFGI